MSVQLSGLDLATVADDVDLALIRKSNTTDYKVTVAVLRMINISGLPSLTLPPQPTDLLMLSQSGVNYQMYFGSAGFSVGTQMWFFMGSVPVSPTFWSIVPNTGDQLLAVRGGSTYTTGGISQGTWLQQDVFGVSGMGLSFNQIPAHSHQIKVRANAGSNPTGVASGSSGTITTIGSQTASDPVQITGSTSGTGGTSAPHNHGQTWRPLANVGIICVKTL
jgi:hypothetical protein